MFLTGIRRRLVRRGRVHALRGQRKQPRVNAEKTGRAYSQLIHSWRPRTAVTSRSGQRVQPAGPEPLYRTRQFQTQSAYGRRFEFGGECLGAPPPSIRGRGSLFATVYQGNPMHRAAPQNEGLIEEPPRREQDTRSCLVQHADKRLPLHTLCTVRRSRRQSRSRVEDVSRNGDRAVKTYTKKFYPSFWTGSAARSKCRAVSDP